jgi:osmoprotectant transport system permease protein
MSTLVLAPDVLAFRWSYFSSQSDEIWQRLVEHLYFTALPMLYGLLIAFPLAVLAARVPRLYGPLLGVTGVLFTIPSLAAFVLLIPFTGLSNATIIIPLTAYTLLILLRNFVEGLRGVPPDVVESAEAMGYRPLRRLLAVELPLALPVMMAGVRIAMVTTIGLVSVSTLVGFGGLGFLMYNDGFQRLRIEPQVAGIVLSVVLAVGADLILLGVQRAMTPWNRGRAA